MSRNDTYRPFWLQLSISVPIAFGFIAIAILSEALYRHSQVHQGFNLNILNVSESHTVQFMKSFLPSLLFVPLNWLYGNTFDSIRFTQPYLFMSKRAPLENGEPEGVAAKDSVLVSYASKGPFGTLVEAFSRRHTVVFITALFSVWSAVYSPLGGAFFNVAAIEFNSTVPILHDTWLNWDVYRQYYDLPSYLNAIGYASIAGAYDTGYPPFVFVDPNETNTAWVVPPFTLARDRIRTSGAINSTERLRVSNMTSFRVHADCAPATSLNVRAVDSAVEVTANIGSSCSATTLMPASGWRALANFTSGPDCINAINASAPAPPSNLSTEARPIVFSYYKNDSAMSTVFCYATYEVHNVTVELNLLSGRLTPQVWDDTLVPGYFNGQDYIWAENWPQLGENTLFDLMLSFSYGDAVLFKPFRGVNEVSTENYTSPILETAFFMAQVAQDTYLLIQALRSLTFLVASSTEGKGVYSYKLDRLVVFGPSAHVITAWLGLTGMTLLGIYLVHSRERRRCKLVAEPAASIATTGALLSAQRQEKYSSQDRTLLLHNLDVADKEEVLESKLRDWRFWLDEHGRLVG